MTWLAIGIGGFLGAVARYAISTYLNNATQGDFPLGTFTVNVAGCLLIGIVAAVVEETDLVSDNARALLQVGFLGSLTTFSTFGLETLDLLRDGETWPALLSVAANVFVGLGAVVLGWVVTRALLS